MADNTKAVDKFIKAKVLAEYRPIVAAFRELVRQNFPELTEEMRLAQRLITAFRATG